MALLVVGAGQALAASYPSVGGSTFTGGAEGWKVSGTCTLPLNLPLVCNGKGEYSGAVGNPAGSLLSSSEVLLNVGGLFATSFTAESPDFTVGDGGIGTVRVARSFSDGGLASLAPHLDYTVSLVDKTGGTEAKGIEETVIGASAFAAKEAPVSLVAGHTYAVKIAAATNTTVAGIGLLGNITADFDNVVVKGPGANPGNNGENGSNGKDGLSNSELRSLLQSSLVGPAVLVNGKKILAKAKCPAKVGRACNITLTGMLSKRKPATARRVGRVSQGKKRPLLLRVKPKAKTKVKQSRTLLFKETVQVGKAHATVYKRLKLIKRG